MSALEIDFQARTAIHQQSAKSALIMANVKNTVDSVQFTQAVLNDLEVLKDRYRATWSTEIDIMVLSAQIRACAFQLQVQSQEQKNILSTHKNDELNVSDRALQHLGFAAAIRLIHTFSDLSKTGTASPSSLQNGDAHVLQRYLPKHFFATLLFAASFIFKWMAFRASELPSPDSGLARNHIQLTYHILSSTSLVPYDEWSRAARMIEVLSRARDLSRLKMTESRPEAVSRLHLLEDTIKAAQEIRETVPRTVEFISSEQTDVEKASNLMERSGCAALNQSSEISDAPQLSQADFTLDMEQGFDWNSLMGFDYSTPPFFDFETDLNIC